MQLTRISPASGTTSSATVSAPARARARRSCLPARTLTCLRPSPSEGRSCGLPPPTLLLSLQPPPLVDLMKPACAAWGQCQVGCWETGACVKPSVSHISKFSLIFPRIFCGSARTARVTAARHRSRTRATCQALQAATTPGISPLRGPPRTRPRPRPASASNRGRGVPAPQRFRCTDAAGGVAPAVQRCTTGFQR